MPPRQRRTAKQNSHPRANMKRSLSQTLQLSTALLPLGSALTLHFSIHDSKPLLLYAALSILSFCLYGFDKYRATNSGWRLRENMLHIVDFLGGWPGGYVAQRFFRHKTWKTSFQVVFWSSVLVHNAAWLWAFLR